MKRAADILKNVFGSTAMLVACILFSASVGFNVIVSLPSIDIDVITILTIVSMWITYASAHKKDTPVKTTGFSIYGGIIVANIVIMSICFALVAVSLLIIACIPGVLSAIQSGITYIMREMGYYVVDTWGALSMMTVLIVVVVSTAVFAFFIVYMASLRKTVLAMRDIVSYTPNNSRRVKIFPIVMVIIGGIINLASGVGQFFLVSKINEFINSLMKYAANELDVSVAVPTISFVTIAPIGPCIAGVASIVFGLVMLRAYNELSVAE